MIIQILGIKFVIETAFLTVALWGLVKLQKLQFNFPGILAAAAVATVLDMIPLVGHYLAIPALCLCMMKVTREDLGGIIFTIGVSYALTFGMNLFLMGALLGNLSVLARSNQPVLPDTELVGDDESFTNDMADAKPAGVQTAANKNPATEARPEEQPTQPVQGNSLSQAIPGMVVKGIIKGAKSSTVMLSMGTKSYSLFEGDSVKIEAAPGKPTVTLVKVNNNSVVLKVDGKEIEVSR